MTCAESFELGCWATGLRAFVHRFSNVVSQGVALCCLDIFDVGIGTIFVPPRRFLGLQLALFLDGSFANTFPGSPRRHRRLCHLNI